MTRTPMTLEQIQLTARTASTVQHFHDRMILNIEKSIGRNLTAEEKTAYMRGVAYEGIRTATKPN